MHVKNVIEDIQHTEQQKIKSIWDLRHEFMDDWNKLRKENDELYRRMAELQLQNENEELERMKKLASASLKKSRNSVAMPSAKQTPLKQPSVGRDNSFEKDKDDKDIRDNDDINQRSTILHASVTPSPNKLGASEVQEDNSNSINASPLKAAGGMEIFITLIENAKDEVLEKVDYLNEKLDKKDTFIIET